MVEDGLLSSNLYDVTNIANHYTFPKPIHINNNSSCMIHINHGVERGYAEDLPTDDETFEHKSLNHTTIDDSFRTAVCDHIFPAPCPQDSNPSNLKDWVCKEAVHKDADVSSPTHFQPPPSKLSQKKYLTPVTDICDFQEIPKTALAFAMLIFNFLLTTTSLAIIHDKVPPYGPLPDAVLDVILARDWALDVSEILIIVTTGIMLAIIVLHPRRFVIFRRLFLMLSLLYLMRSATMFVTVLPVSSHTYYCSPRLNTTDYNIIIHRSLNLFFGMGLTINGKHIYCGDYIYSGHTTILVMSYLMISEYSSSRIRGLHWAAWIMSVTGVLMVLISHSHYTVDVIIGYFVTTRLFWMYHTCANNPLLKSTSKRNYLSREWWFFIFQYFEASVTEPVLPLAAVPYS